MASVGLLYVAAVLFVNGAMLLGWVDGRSAAPMNLFVGTLQVITPTYLIFTAAGVKDVSTYDAEYYPGMGIHEMGTARMGTSPKNSVLNKWNQVWDAPNVFVTDGACMASTACQNPSLTYMALTARAADHAVNELNRRNL